MRCDWESQIIRALDLHSESETVVAQLSYSLTQLQDEVNHVIRKIAFSEGCLTLFMSPKFEIIPTYSPRE